MYEYSNGDATSRLGDFSPGHLGLATGLSDSSFGIFCWILFVKLGEWLDCVGLCWTHVI